MNKHPICPSCGKRCYSRRGAGDALKEAGRGGKVRKTIPRSMYRCKDCGFYHLSHYKVFYKKYEVYKENRRDWRRRKQSPLDSY